MKYSFGQGSKLKLIMLCGLVVVLASSCKSAQRLLADVQMHTADFPYLTPEHMLPASDSPYAITCNVALKSSIPDTTLVRKDDFWCVPLMFVTMWEANHTVYSGHDLINGSIEGHFESSLANALYSSGHYPLAQSADARFRIELEVDSIKTKGYYHNYGNYMVLPLGFYVYISWSGEEHLGPVETHFVARYSVFDGDKLIFKQDCSMSDFLSEYHSYNQMSDEEAAAAFVNDVAFSIDNCIYRMSDQVVRQSNMVLDIYNDVSLRIGALHNEGE